MDEAQIARELASKIPDNKPELNPRYPEPETPEEPRPTFGNQLPLEGSQMTAELNDYFNIGIPQTNTMGSTHWRASGALNTWTTLRRASSRQSRSRSEERRVGKECRSRWSS